MDNLFYYDPQHLALLPQPDLKALIAGTATEAPPEQELMANALAGAVSIYTRLAERNPGIVEPKHIIVLMSAFVSGASYGTTLVQSTRTAKSVLDNAMKPSSKESPQQ